VKYKKCCERDEPAVRPARAVATPSPDHSPRDVGLSAPPRRPDRPPSPADYDRLIAALSEDEPEDVRLEGGLLVFDLEVDKGLKAAIKRLRGRRFHWAERVWTVPATPDTATAVVELLDAHPWLTVSDGARAWLHTHGRWSASVGVWARDGRPVFVVVTQSGEAPPELDRSGAPWHPGWRSLPLDAPSGELIAGLDGAALDTRARAAVDAVRAGAEVPGARLRLGHDAEDEPRFELEIGWAAARRDAFLLLPEASRLAERASGVMFVGQAERLALPADASLVDALDAFLAEPPVTEVAPDAAALLAQLRTEHHRAETTVALSRAHSAELELPALGGTLEPFQRAGVAYALAQRRTFLADEQGLGKTVEALAALEADGAYPAVVVCPASVKLNWEREAAHWLPHRAVAVLHGRAPDDAADHADIVVLNYEILDAHADRLAARRPRAAVFDESHYCKEPRAKRTQAALRLADGLDPWALRLALTGTPILNRPKELTAQLRLLGRLGDFSSGARLGRRFRGPDSLERLHWHLRAHCYVRRTKAEVLPQLPAKRWVTLPVELANETEYRLAERDVIAWLRTLPLDFSTLEARVAAALRNERLVRLNHLRQLVGQGKLRAALAWIDDWRASGEPLVVFAEHLAVQRAVLARHPDALHVLGSDVCSMRAAAHGITLTRASNVAFLELDWTPARHDQAEDRCHRMGQASAVTAWYLLTQGTIDETIARLLARKRSVIGAVTDGRAAVGEGVVDAVASELRSKDDFVTAVAA